MKKSLVYFFLLRVGTLACGIALLCFFIQTIQRLSNEHEIASAAQVNATVTILPAVPTMANGDVDFSSLGLVPSTVTPSIPQAGVASVYSVDFVSNKAIGVGGKIVLVFPLGFQFDASCPSSSRLPENADMNGVSSGTVTPSSVVCNSSLQSATVVVGGSSIGRGDRVQFILQGVIGMGNADNAPYFVGIETRDENDSFLDLKTSIPFFLSPAGSQRISGVVFNDNGAGLFGFAKDGSQNGSEPGLAGMNVCLSGAVGTRCQATSSSGTYEFSGLTNGLYSLSASSPKNSTVVGGPYRRDIQLGSGQSRENVQFAFVSPEYYLTVFVAGIPQGTDIDVFAASSGTVGPRVRSVQEAEWNGESMRKFMIPVSDGLWDVGVESTTGQGSISHASKSTPISFIIPKPQRIHVEGSDAYVLSFSLRSAGKMIIGRVVDDSGTGIQNARVTARLGTGSVEAGGDIVTQSSSNGDFQLSVTTGTYVIRASALGMPSGAPMQVTVKDDTGNGAIDHNTTDDVFSGSTLITNDGDGGADNLVLTIEKGEHVLSGRVLDESGKPVAYARVSGQRLDATGLATGAPVYSVTSPAGLFSLFVSDGTWRFRGFVEGYGEIPGNTVQIDGTDIANQDMKVSSADFSFLTGRVTQGGGAVSGALVSANNRTGGNTTTTDESGSYSLRVRPGSDYSISAYVEGSGDLAPIEHVTIGSEQTIADLNFSIQRSGTLVVTVPGVSDAVITAVASDGQSDETDANTPPGTYTLSLPPGTYTVSAQSADYGDIGKKEQVTVGSGKATAVQFIPSVPRIVSGNVVGDASFCSQGVSVSATDTVSGNVSTTATDENGRYTFSLPSGSYRLNSTKIGCVDKDEPLFFSVTNDDRVLAKRKMILANAAVTGRIVLLGKNSTIETRVTAQSSNGTVATAMVNLGAKSGINYTLVLTPGTWSVSARADGYTSSEHSLVVGNTGATLDMNLSAIPGYTLTEPVVALVTPSRGGIVRNNDAGAGFALTIPAGVLGSSSEGGSVSTKVTTAVVTQTQTAHVLGGKGIEITPRDSSGNPISTLSSSGGTGARITIPYSKSDLSLLGGDEKMLALAVWSDDKQQWESLPTTVDVVHGTLSATAKHFSIFAPVLPSVPVVSASVDPSFPSSQTTQNGSVGTAVPGTVLPGRPAITGSSAQEEKNNSPLAMQDQRPLMVNENSITQKKFLILGEPLHIESSFTTGQSSLGEEQHPSLITQRKKNTRAQAVISKNPLESIRNTPPTHSLNTVSAHLFETSLTLKNDNRTFAPGDELLARGSITKNNMQKEAIPISFTIRDSKGGTRMRDTDTVSVESSLQFIKKFKLSRDIPEGFYTILFSAKNGGDVSISSDTFHITSPHAVKSTNRAHPTIAREIFTPTNATGLIALVSSVIAVALMILGLFTRL